MSARQPKDDRVYRIITNALLWLCFGGVLIGVNALESKASPTISVPPEIITRLINLKLYLTQLVASALLFALFAFITHKAKDKANFNRGQYFIGLVFGEWGAILINFGSLLFIAGIIANAPLYWPGTLANYAFGYYLLPKR